MWHYAGIGSRNTPEDILSKMERLAHRLASLGWTLRSGHAPGADQAFEQGCNRAQGLKEIWLPNLGFFDSDSSLVCTTDMKMAVREYHPLGSFLKGKDLLLHGRNMAQVFGASLAHPVQMVVCWTPDGCEHHSTRTKNTGGTGTAIEAASRWNIPVFNLANPDALERLFNHVLGLHRHFHVDGTSPDPYVGSHPCIFVFGSNDRGRHGKGAALEAARQWGAQEGVGRGLSGKSYAIATKDHRIQSHGLDVIEPQIKEAIEFMKSHPDYRFFVTRIGCQLAGFQNQDIAPLWRKAPLNASFAQEWSPWLSTPVIEPFPCSIQNESFLRAQIHQQKTKPTLG